MLCGSVTRAVHAMLAAKEHYEQQGYRVHMPVKDDTRPAEEHAARWFALIDACGPDDLVVICSEPDEHYGRQTLIEWNHALAGAKRVRHWIGGERSELPSPPTRRHDLPPPAATVAATKRHDG